MDGERTPGGQYVIELIASLTLQILADVSGYLLRQYLINENVHTEAMDRSIREHL